jgi:Trk-type K+ transport system membrane component
MKIIGVVIELELGFLSQVFKMIWPFLTAVIISAAIVYLLGFVIAFKRLFQAFWASIEDEY